MCRSARGAEERGAAMFRLRLLWLRFLLYQGRVSCSVQATGMKDIWFSSAFGAVDRKFVFCFRDKVVDVVSFL
jgi:hypothetical protein